MGGVHRRANGPKGGAGSEVLNEAVFPSATRRGVSSTWGPTRGLVSFPRLNRLRFSLGQGDDAEIEGRLGLRHGVGERSFAHDEKVIFDRRGNLIPQWI